MFNSKDQGINLFHFGNLAERKELLHFATGRPGGCSDGNYASLNLGFNSGDAREQVLQNRQLLCRELGIGPAQLIFPKQTHTATVKIIDDRFLALNEEQRARFLNETDALITDIKGVCIAVKTADCVPVLLYDPNRQVAASIHAGWRGTVQRIAAIAVRKMVEEFRCKPEELLAGIGPSISPGVYEVGEEVWQQFESRHYSPNGKPDKRLLNLWNANRDQLTEAGLRDDRIETLGLCSFSHPDLFFSARRDGAKTGRMASGVMLR